MRPSFRAKLFSFVAVMLVTAAMIFVTTKLLVKVAAVC
jgi:hypothetical protein